MEDYKLTIALKPDLSSEKTEDLNKKVKKAVKEAGGEVKDVESLGIKPLSYEISGLEQASFGEFSISVPKGKVNDMKKEIERFDDFLRVMVTKA